MKKAKLIYKFFMILLEIVLLGTIIVCLWYGKTEHVMMFSLVMMVGYLADIRRKIQQKKFRIYIDTLNVNEDNVSGEIHGSADLVT